MHPTNTSPLRLMFQAVVRQTVHVLADGARRREPDLSGVARGGQHFQRTPQMPQTVGLPDDVRVQRQA
ncbi:MAG: hypothetical protein H7232_08360, partial [Aeromicrobium sp.]|nr:hypothetical protein [Burkholderiales bacterium]